MGIIENRTNQFKEVEAQMQLENLIKAGVLTFSRQAPDNLQTLEGINTGTFGLAAKDYPAQTPLVWNNVYRQLGFSHRNTRFVGQVDKKDIIFDSFREDQRYIGGDVGVGFKNEVLGLLDTVDPTAKLAGSVNVVVKQLDKQLVGYNTDGLGFFQSLEEMMEQQDKSLAGKKVLILGAGGTGSAIAVALALKGVPVIVLNRTAQKAEELAGRINSYLGQELAQGASRQTIKNHIALADAIVATVDDPQSPLEQFVAFGEIPSMPSREPTALELAQNQESAQELISPLRRKPIIADVMLRLEPTATLKFAQAAGLPALDGKSMFVAQAIEAFCLIHKRELEEKGIDKEKLGEAFQVAANS